MLSHLLGLSKMLDDSLRIPAPLGGVDSLLTSGWGDFQSVIFVDDLACLVSWPANSMRERRREEKSRQIFYNTLFSRAIALTDSADFHASTVLNPGHARSRRCFKCGEVGEAILLDLSGLRVPRHLLYGVSIISRNSKTKI